MSKSLADILANSFPDLKDSFYSKQFELSEKLIEKRMDLNLPFEKMAEVVGLSVDEYINYEYGSNSIPIEDYYEKINIINKFQIEKEFGFIKNNHFEMELDKDLNEDYDYKINMDNIEDKYEENKSNNYHNQRNEKNKFKYNLSSKKQSIFSLDYIGLVS